MDEVACSASERQTADLTSLFETRSVEAKADNMSINKVTLFQLFIIVLSVGAVIGSKVNKERQLRQQKLLGGSTAGEDKGHRSDFGEDAMDFGYISDSQGLPTRFGDEDDVLYAKKQNESGSHNQPLLPGGGVSSTSGQSLSVANVKPLLGHDNDYDYDYEEELDHPDENDSHDKDISGSNHNHDIGDYTDRFDGVDQIESFGEGSDTTSSLPVFLVEPQNTYVIKNRPAVLQCKASHAFQVSCLFLYSHCHFLD